MFVVPNGAARFLVPGRRGVDDVVELGAKTGSCGACKRRLVGVNPTIVSPATKLAAEGFSITIAFYT